MVLTFTKMHGCGNDYIYFNCLNEQLENPEEIAKKLSHRHFSVGGDGIVMICSSNVADAKMRMFNSDGSEGKMCGNGIRCVGKYVAEKGYTDKTTLQIETLSGIKTLYLTKNAGTVESVSVSMGKAKPADARSFIWNGEIFLLHPIDMGNPHAVIFVQDAEKIDIQTVGEAVQSLFPGGVNVEFVNKTADNRLRMRVWERGSGMTLACGTGACAAAAAAVNEGLCTREQCVSIDLDGGTLQVQVLKENEIIMTGPAAFVYEGETHIC